MNFENDYNDDYDDDNCEIKFLTSKTNCFKWNKLVFEDEEPYIFHDTRLDLTNEKIFDLWETSLISEKTFILIHIRKFI